MPRVNLNLKRSISTDAPVGLGPFDFKDQAAEVEQNTGIERNGGITNIYEQGVAHGTAGTSVITGSGDLLQVDSTDNVLINGVSIGNVGPLAVTSRGRLAGYSDAAWTSAGTIIAIVRVGSAIRVDELSVAGAVLNTRSTTFAMPAVTITSLALVKYPAMAFANNLEFLISNNKITYVLGESGTSVRVAGSQTWTSRTSASAQQWSSVCWSPVLGLFCAVAINGAVGVQVMTSPNGITWTSRTSASAQLWRSVCWSPELGLFCAVASDGAVGVQVMTSPNGTTWTSRTSASAQQWVSVCWSPELGVFCSVARDGAVGVQVMTSPDGTTWTSRTSASAQDWRSVCWSSELGLFCSVSYDGTVMTSPNGITWTSRTSASAQRWNSVCWSPELSLFCAVSLNGAVGVQVMTSPDGVTWTSRTSASAQQWYSVCWSPELGLFCAVATDGAVGVQVMTSSDGITWIIGTSASALQWISVCWSPELGLFCAVALDGVVGVQVMTSTQIITGATFCWKFSASNYLAGDQGRSGSWYIGDIVGSPAAITDATWVVIDQFAGTAYSRAILTFNVKKNSANLLTGIGEVGYTQAGVYSATPVYYGVALAAVTVTITENVSGPGYAEATFTRSDTSTNIYYYQAPIMAHGPGVWYDYQQSQTHTLAGGYGRLTDFVGNSLGATASLRIPLIGETPSLISAAVVSGESLLPTDNLGVPVTHVGEFDERFVPHVVDDGATEVNVIYRYNGTLFHFTISEGTHSLSRISDNIYMVNSLTPINAIDVTARTMSLGTNDYNGRILFRSSAAIIAATQIVGIMQGLHAGSIDAGAKTITQTFSPATSLVPGIGLPTFIDRAITDYGVNIYLAGEYLTTYQAVNVYAADPDLDGVLYVADTRLPFAMGYGVNGSVIQTEINTVFTGVGVTGSSDINYGYLGYELGNELPGIFQSFMLFGQVYIFDGLYIYLATFNGSLYTGRGPAIAPATGMVLIASSPTAIYFLSDFDNSIYVFNGGRDLTKRARMTALEAVTDGVYSVHDNTLLMQTEGTFIWVRDEIVTVNDKLAAQTGTRLYDTTEGIIIVNDTTQWRYTFLALSGSTVVPLTWQSPYLGLNGGMRSVASEWLVGLYNAAPAAVVDVTLTCESYDEDGYASNVKTLSINPSEWSGLGMAWLRIAPKTQRCLASSVKIYTTARLVIHQVAVEWFEDESAAKVKASRSG